MARGDCEVMLAEARWMAKEARDLSAFLQRLSQPVAACCSEQELEDLFDMLETVDRMRETAAQSSPTPSPISSAA
jgi:hypothetical protein